MSKPIINFCPGTLAAGFDNYSRTCLNRVFNGRKVSPILPYNSPLIDKESYSLFEDNRSRLSFSGVQEKFSIVLEKNILRLTKEGEKGMYILKPIPAAGKKADQIPANEHLTMQIARQAFSIETAENALIFFKNGSPAYITKRFDIREDESKWAQDDFASLAGKTPQTHGEHYKYKGSYFELFELMKRYVPAYKSEAPKLFKLIVFNYISSNGDAHLKNFSLLETPMGDFRLSPAYDLLNSQIHINDNDFALEDGLILGKLGQGKISKQFENLAVEIGLNEKQFNSIIAELSSKGEKVQQLIAASYLDDSTKRNYWQAYQARLKKTCGQ